MFVFKFLFLIVFISSAHAVDPFAQRGGGDFLSFTFSTLSESDDISILARDRAAPELILKTSQSTTLKGSLRLATFLYVYGERIDSEWEQDKRAGIDFDSSEEFKKKQTGTGIGLTFDRYTLEIGSYKIEDVLFYTDAIGNNNYTTYEADRIKYEFSYFYRMSQWFGINFGVMGWVTKKPELPDGFTLSDQARIMKMGVCYSFGHINLGFNYKYGFKEYALKIEEIKSIEKVYYQAFETSIMVMF
jgi:hypothetical protein